jgi:hypothetical protein
MEEEEEEEEEEGKHGGREEGGGGGIGRVSVSACFERVMAAEGVLEGGCERSTHAKAKDRVAEGILLVVLRKKRRLPFAPLCCRARTLTTDISQLSSSRATRPNPCVCASSSASVAVATASVSSATRRALEAASEVWRVSEVMRLSSTARVVVGLPRSWPTPPPTPPPPRLPDSGCGCGSCGGALRAPRSHDGDGAMLLLCVCCCEAASTRGARDSSLKFARETQHLLL